MAVDGIYTTSQKWFVDLTRMRARKTAHFRKRGDERGRERRREL